MSIPPFCVMRPQLLRRLPDGRALNAPIPDDCAFTDAERQELLPSSTQSRFTNRLCGAKSYLERAHKALNDELATQLPDNIADRSPLFFAKVVFGLMPTTGCKTFLSAVAHFDEPAAAGCRTIWFAGHPLRGAPKIAGALSPESASNGGSPRHDEIGLCSVSIPFSTTSSRHSGET